MYKPLSRVLTLARSSQSVLLMKKTNKNKKQTSMWSSGYPLAGAKLTAAGGTGQGVNRCLQENMAPERSEPKASSTQQPLQPAAARLSLSIHCLDFTSDTSWRPRVTATEPELFGTEILDKIYSATVVQS